MDNIEFDPKAQLIFQGAEGVNSNNNIFKKENFSI